MRRVKFWPSASEATLVETRFGMNRRLVLMFEWLTLWPTIGPTPVISQRRDMARYLGNKQGRDGTCGPARRAGDVEDGASHVKVSRARSRSVAADSEGSLWLEATQLQYVVG